MAVPLERTIIVVEDDPSIADLVDLYLRNAGFRSLLAASAERGIELWRQHAPALLIVDVGLPGMNGFDLCRTIRRDASVPMIFITARDDEMDRIEGLELGADDYIVKPFSPRELVARVNAVLRRGDPQPPTWARRMIGEGIVLDTERREVLSHGESVPLATKEFDLLAHLARHLGVALSRQQLLDGVWGPEWEGDQRTVDVHIRQLRKKIGPDLPLATVWGIGYRLG